MLNTGELLIAFFLLTLFCAAIGVTADAVLADIEEMRKRGRE